MELLSTIRVPKNLLYLTDRLPKPHYHELNNKRKQGKTFSITRHTENNIIDELGLPAV